MPRRLWWWCRRCKISTLPSFEGWFPGGTLHSLAARSLAVGFQTRGHPGRQLREIQLTELVERSWHAGQAHHDLLLDARLGDSNFKCALARAHPRGIVPAWIYHDAKRGAFCLLRDQPFELLGAPLEDASAFASFNLDLDVAPIIAISCFVVRHAIVYSVFQFFAIRWVKCFLSFGWLR